MNVSPGADFNADPIADLNCDSTAGSNANPTAGTAAGMQRSGWELQLPILLSHTPHHPALDGFALSYPAYSNSCWFLDSIAIASGFDLGDLV